MALNTNVVLNFLANTDQIEKKFKEFKTNFDDFAKRGAIAFGALSASFSLVGIAALKSAGQMEQWTIAFEVMLGSADKAEKLLNEIKDFAAKTPFELPQLVEGSKRLLAYNIEAEKIIPTMEALGNISAGVGTDKLPQLITAFGQVRAKGKLMGQELLQFTEAGVDLGGNLQAMLGVSRAELEKMISAGKVGFPLVEQALANLGTGTGKFAGLMERQSKSLFGVISNIKDNIIQALIGIGDQLLPFAKKIANVVKELTGKLLNMSDGMKKFIAFGGAFIAIFTGAIAGALTLGIGINAAVQSLIALKKVIQASTIVARIFAISINAIPFVAILTAMLAFVAAYKTNFLGIADFTNRVVETIKILFGGIFAKFTAGMKLIWAVVKKFAQMYIESWASIFKIVSIMFKSFVEVFLKGINWILQKLGKSAIQMEIGLGITIGNIKDAWKQAGEIIVANKEKTDAQQKEGTTNVANHAKATAAQQSIWEDEEFKKREKKFLDAKVNAVQAKQDEAAQIKAINLARTEEELLNLENSILKEQELKLAELEAKKEFWMQEGVAKQEIDTMFKEQSIALENNYAGRLAAIEKRKTGFRKGAHKINKFLNSDQVRDTKSTLDSIGELAKGDAKLQKGLSIGKATINVAEGITKALSLPFPANLAAAASVAAQGAVQIARIGATSFAVGTDFVKENMLAFLHKGEAVVPARENQFLQSGQLALSAPGATTNNQSSRMNVNVYVEGNLIGGTPEELARELHKTISDQINAGFLVRFPTEAS